MDNYIAWKLVCDAFQKVTEKHWMVRADRPTVLQVFKILFESNETNQKYTDDKQLSKMLNILYFTWLERLNET